MNARVTLIAAILCGAVGVGVAACGGSDSPAPASASGGSAGQSDASAGSGRTTPDAGTDSMAGQGGFAGSEAGPGGNGGAGGSDGGIAGSGGIDSGTGGSGGTDGGTAGSGGNGGAGGSTNPPFGFGTEFWAVDLPNERYASSGLVSDWPAQKPWALLISNPGPDTAEITVTENIAAQGELPTTQVVATASISPGSVTEIELPTREVTGWTDSTDDPPGPPMTQLSSKALRVNASAPVSVVQLNAKDKVFSNDAATLIPTSQLGTTYRVVGSESANPTVPSGMPAMTGIPDHASITILATQPSTSVTVTLTAGILADGVAVPSPVQAGAVLQFGGLGQFDVLNLASNGTPGDFTGSVVQADKPVAVFFSAERVLVPNFLGPTPPPGASDTCCTEHAEEQLLPDSALASAFVVAHSPWRSTGSYREPDILRFLAGDTSVSVSTNLPSPFNAFTLQPGEAKWVWTTQDAVVTATGPVTLAKMLASQSFTTDMLGDPSMLQPMPVGQHRAHHLFTIPSGWARTHLEIATEKGNSLLLDSQSPAGCETTDAGQLSGVDYVAIRCPATVGTHTLVGTKPSGVTLYGYDASTSFSIVVPGY